jgi:hypothetical protein
MISTVEVSQSLPEKSRCAAAAKAAPHYRSKT